MFYMANGWGSCLSDVAEPHQRKYFSTPRPNSVSGRVTDLLFPISIKDLLLIWMMTQAVCLARPLQKHLASFIIVVRIITPHMQFCLTRVHSAQLSRIKVIVQIGHLTATLLCPSTCARKRDLIYWTKYWMSNDVDHLRKWYSTTSVSEGGLHPSKYSQNHCRHVAFKLPDFCEMLLWL